MIGFAIILLWSFAGLVTEIVSKSFFVDNIVEKVIYIQTIIISVLEIFVFGDYTQTLTQTQITLLLVCVILNVIVLRKKTFTCNYSYESGLLATYADLLAETLRLCNEKIHGLVPKDKERLITDYVLGEMDNIQHIEYGSFNTSVYMDKYDRIQKLKYLVCDFKSSTVEEFTTKLGEIMKGVGNNG
jgi:hypothetical protein